ncbi:hypothetical protein [Nonomuraea sp. SYSU D8015]|uniref:hypothetical protein n=1 Tax=Nonomuraea sp. SYSU D8015 TaxID=2593644 RepID=UPI0016607957|nr:hypothetical protein [Nonomuraea sp. SYSU D8015]
MFKRRLAVLGAVCALALTGLAGSALASEPPSTAGAKATCTTSDGQTIELPAGEPGKPVGIVVGPDGKVKKIDPDEAVKIRAVPAEKAPEGVTPPAEVEAVDPPAELEGDVMKAVPALPAEALPQVGVKPGEDGVAKTVKIVCKKSE